LVVGRQKARRLRSERGAFLFVELVGLGPVLSPASVTTTSRYLYPDAARIQEMVEEL
jgi:hypothetical protein